jgi:hypothetical protein
MPYGVGKCVYGAFYILGLLETKDTKEIKIKVLNYA